MSRTVKTYPYVVYYKDGTYQTIDLKKSDFEKIEKYMTSELQPYAVSTSIGIMTLGEIRSIFLRIDPPIIEAKTQEDFNTDYPNMTLEESAYLWEEMQKQEALQTKRETEVEYQ